MKVANATSFFTGEKGNPQREWSTAVGGTLVGDPSSGGGESQGGGSNGINWNEYNYPPLLRLFHFRISELEGKTKALGRELHALFLTTLAGLGFNILTTIVLICGPLNPIEILYSILQAIIVLPCTGYGMYSGFKGIAKPSEWERKKAAICFGVMILPYLFFAIFYTGSTHGWASYMDMNNEKFENMSVGFRGFWHFVIVVESLTWTGCIGLASWLIFSLLKFNPYEGQEGQNP